MNAALALLVFSAFIFGAQSACDISLCTGAASTDCTTRNTYYNCLLTESAGCTSSQTTTKLSIDATATAELAAKTLLGCSGAGGLVVSVSTLLLSVIAVFLKM